MPKRFVFAAASLVALLVIAVDVTSVSAEENPLASCLANKEDQLDVRMKACEEAARLGHPKAILLIGMAHVYGKGVAKDYVQAHMYFEILRHVVDTLEPRHRAEARKYSEDLMVDLKKRMTSAEISRAEALAGAWINDNLKQGKGKEVR